MVGIICHMWSRNCLPFWNTRVSPRFLLNVLVGFVWFILSNYMSSQFLPPCYDVHYDFLRKNDVRVHLLHSFVLSVVYMFSNTTGVTCWAGIANPSRHLSSPPPDISEVCVARCLVFSVMFYRLLFVFLSFSFVLSVRYHFAASDYTFGIFKICLAFQGPKTTTPNELLDIGHSELLGIDNCCKSSFMCRKRDTFPVLSTQGGVINVQSSSHTSSGRPSGWVLPTMETLCLISILLYSFRIGELHYIECYISI